MPKIVDHEQRRREILAATWRVIDSVGLDGVTTRRIAAEAGYSNGVLAHYFTDKDDILASALQLAHVHVRARMEAATLQRTGLDLLRAVISEALPLDAERLLEARIEFSFLSRALNSPALRTVHARELDRFRRALRLLVRTARGAGEIDTTRSDEDVVGEILILIDGLSIQALLAPERITPRVQRARLEALLGAFGAADAEPPARRTRAG